MNTFIQAVTLDYILLCVVSVLLVAWAMYRVLTSTSQEQSDDEDGSGGFDFNPPLLPDVGPTYGKVPEREEVEELELAEF
ncbi:MAG TPA: hypothetical protein PKD70_10595 [Saprospiraceae bacterium]|nr:hypothetical protein [Saprospiraceae bacterium]HMP14319.1 hypothetical protein [Saprospiraceae bacterium]